MYIIVITHSSYAISYINVPHLHNDTLYYICIIMAFVLELLVPHYSCDIRPQRDEFPVPKTSNCISEF